MSIQIHAINNFAKKYSQVDVLAPQMALGPDYDRQTIRQEHFISQSSQISWLEKMDGNVGLER